MGDYEDIATNSHGRKKERNIKIPNKRQPGQSFCTGLAIE